MNTPAITTSKSLTKAELEEIADRIRTRIRRTAEDIIAVGHDLAEVKAQLGHGKFLDWIDREFDMSERSARNYMSVAAWAEAKSATVADLAPATLYLLAAPSTPEDIENEVLADIESGKPVDTKEVKARIEEARVEQDETSQDDPKPAQAKKPRRSRQEIERDAFFEGRLPVLEQAAGVDFELPAPKLNAEDAKQAIKQIKKAEACLRHLRREIERQHAEPAPTVDQQGPDHEVRR